MRRIFQQPDIQATLGQYKEELKSMYNYAKEYNQYKLGETTTSLEQKGWIILCQQFSLCDVPTANNILKQNQKERGRSGLTYEDFLKVLFGLAARKDIEQEL